MDEFTSTGGRGTSRRRSQRVLLQVPILVHGLQDKNRAFEEETSTLAVNAHGALILLATRVDAGQKLMLLHRKTQEEQECSVVWQGPAKGGKIEVGVEFTHPKPGFWRVAFPPEDWTPRHPDARTRSQA
jgi:hypothetical protein